MIPTINATRLLRELHHLATLTDCPPSPDPHTTAVTRIVFTPRDLEARAYITGLAQTAGFRVHTDAIGNTFFRFLGTDPDLPAIGTGSHADAIPHAGMYDGTVGVLGGLEAMRSLKEFGFTPHRSIETILFTSEEPTRFGIGCLGSRLLGGVLSPQAADALPDLLAETETQNTEPTAKTGLTLHQVRTAAGFTGDLSTVPLALNHYAAWVELHIEQGLLLEQAMQSVLQASTGDNQVVAGDSQFVPGDSQFVPGDSQVVAGDSQFVAGHNQVVAGDSQFVAGDSQFVAGHNQVVAGDSQFVPGNNRVPQGFSLGSHRPAKSEEALAPEAIPTVLGIVTAIAAPASYRYTIDGLGGHAGALLMPDRRDALCAAAELILSVERHTLAANSASGTSNSVATIGTIAVHPGAVNSVPSRVTLMLDIRDTDPVRREATMAALRADTVDIEARRSVTITEQQINADLPATCGPHLLDTLRTLCNEESVPYKEMVSRAYHDTSFMARVAPVAMLFIPCRNGVSHRPDEYSSPAAIALGTRILALTLARLANEP